MSDSIAIILSESRAKGASQQKLEEEIAARLDVLLVPHLYDLMSGGPALEHLRAIRTDMVVLAWLQPRAAYWTLRVGGVEGHFGAEGSAAGKERTIRCFDLHVVGHADTLCEELHRIAPDLGHDMAGPRRIEEATRPRWYPVIDRSRCVNCLECLNFCLFGVYSTDAQDEIVVEQPDRCRPGCPACARVCPSAAIMFPQHADPAIAGDPNASPLGSSLDVSALLRPPASPMRNRPQPQSTPDNLDSLVNGIDDLEL